MTEHRLTLVVAFPVAVVAGCAAWVSYGHIETLALTTGHQTLAAARLLPFSVDFLIVAGSVLLLVGYGLGWLGVVFGVAGTLFANVESGVPYGAEAAVIAAWPAVAFTVASFMLERWLRHRVRPTVNQDRQETVQEVVADLVAEELPVLADQPEPLPEPEVPAVVKTFTQPDLLKRQLELVADDQPKMTDVMAVDVVNRYRLRNELDRLWEIVDGNSERALVMRFNLRTRNQGVRLKILRKTAAEAAG